MAVHFDPEMLALIHARDAGWDAAAAGRCRECNGTPESCAGARIKCCPDCRHAHPLPAAPTEEPNRD